MDCGYGFRECIPGRTIRRFTTSLDVDFSVVRGGPMRREAMVTCSTCRALLKYVFLTFISSMYLPEEAVCQCVYICMHMFVGVHMCVVYEYLCVCVCVCPAKDLQRNLMLYREL